MAGPAQPGFAHVAIVLEFVAPRPGATVAPDSEARLFARPMLFGVPDVRFRLFLDEEPLNPRTGNRVSRSTAAVIRAGQTLRIPLNGVSPGRHILAVTYRPDRDARPRRASVSFTMAAEGTSVGVKAALVTGALLALLVLGILVLRGGRRRRPSIDAASVNGN